MQPINGETTVLKLSVIVPSFNLENYIGPCLTSLLTQETTFDFEVIVCDDGSTDNTAAMISSYTNKFENLKIIFKKQNEGLAKNIQTLISHVSGQYIAYVDGDDLALPGKLQKQVDYLDHNKSCAIVFHESDMFETKSNFSLKRYTQDYYNWNHIPKRSTIEHLIRYGTYMQASSVMFRNHKKIYATIPHNYEIILDYPFYINNAGYLNANIDFIPEVLGRYRVHPNSFGSQTRLSTERRLTSLQDMITACQSASIFGIKKHVILEGISQHYYSAALYFLQRKNFGLFTDNIIKSSSYNYFFDDRHREAWELRNTPNLAFDALYPKNVSSS